MRRAVEGQRRVTAIFSRPRSARTMFQISTSTAGKDVRNDCARNNSIIIIISMTALLKHDMRPLP